MNRVGSIDGAESHLSFCEGIELKKVLVPERIRRMRQIAAQVYVDERVKTYILDIVFATRSPEDYGLDLRNLIRYGASPRASIGLMAASRAHAFLRGRGFVVPDDIKAVAPGVLRHRVLLTYEAEAEGMNPDRIVERILNKVKAP
jgi:MoxR-like ATPase